MQKSNEKADSIAKKDWLDLSWKYFQQHAQQRISYFNFFVIFSTILTTGMVTTLQKGFALPYISVAIGCLQSFLAFMFLKIDQRNRFLTRHAEETIIEIEARDNALNEKACQLFTSERKNTLERQEQDKSIFWLKRLLTHGESYKIIYIFFMAWGMLGVILPFVPQMKQEEINKVHTIISLRHDKTDSIKTVLQQKDSITELLFENLNQLGKQIDSLEISYKNFTNKEDTGLQSPAAN
jgi:hypothetical protein